MSALKILRFPHKNLRKTAPPVMQVDDSLAPTIQQMYATLYGANAWGLAATQVNLPLRLFVMDISSEQNQPLCLINPEILEREGSVELEAGCLSFPGIYFNISRANKITVKYQDEKGAVQILTTEGQAAFCIQQQCDYLNGVLFIDYLSNLKRSRLLKKLQKYTFDEGHHHGCGEPSCTIDHG